MSEHFTKVQRRIGLGLASAMLIGGGIEGVNWLLQIHLPFKMDQK